jgi:hypothetical protein
MKTANLFCAAAITVAAAIPSVASASIENRSAAACAQEFAARVNVSGEVPSYKFDYRSTGLSSVVATYFATQYTFDLMARNPKSGAEVARATCVVSRAGRIISLVSTPVVAGETKLASRL